MEQVVPAMTSSSRRLEPIPETKFGLNEVLDEARRAIVTIQLYTSAVPVSDLCANVQLPSFGGGLLVCIVPERTVFILKLQCRKPNSEQCALPSDIPPCILA